MKKRNKKIFAIIFAISLLFNIVFLSRCSDSKVRIADTPNVVQPVAYENTSIGYNDGLVIEKVSEDIEDGSVTLTATVSPSDAENKEVDWSVAWKSGASKASQTVTNYVTVTPISDGSNIATVKCLTPFPGDEIIVTVRTRVGGFTANCTCTYVGTPTGLQIEIDDELIQHDSSVNVDMITLGAGITYDFDLKLLCTFGEVDDSYSPNYVASHEGIGKFNKEFRTYSQGSVDEADIEEVTLDAFVNKTDGGYKNYLKYSISGGKLHIEAMNSIRKVEQVTSSGTAYTKGWYFKGYSGNEPYLKITVRETTSNVSKDIYVRVVNTVSGVTLSKTTITF